MTTTKSLRPVRATYEAFANGSYIDDRTSFVHVDVNASTVAVTSSSSTSSSSSSSSTRTRERPTPEDDRANEDGARGDAGKDVTNDEHKNVTFQAASSKASNDVVRYTAEALRAIARDRASEFALPSELQSSTLECVLNDANAEIARIEGSVWGRHVKEDMKPKRSTGMMNVNATTTGTTTREVFATANEEEEKMEDGEGADGECEAIGAIGGNVANRGTTMTTTMGHSGKKTTTVSTTTVSTTTNDAEKSKRMMKGILNKMSTNEKMNERLFEQARECALAAEANAREAFVGMIFDKAAYEGSLAGAYAELCAKLSATLPALANGMTFKKLLISLAQDEFENSTSAREATSGIVDRGDREAQAKRARLKTVGIARLIGELFKRTVVAASLVHAVIGELLGEPRSTPCEDYVEALCALLAACGGELESSPKTSKAVMDMYFARLNVLGECAEIDIRTRFLCRDVIELRSHAWAARPGKKSHEAKKLADVGADVDFTSSPAVSDEILFPEGPANAVARPGPLEGPYQKPSHAVVLPTAAARGALEDAMRRDARARAEAKADAAIDAALGSSPTDVSTSSYDAEEVDQKIKSLVDEYAAAGDVAEALLCVKDLIARTPDAEATKSAIAKALVDYVINVSSAKIADSVGVLLAACFTAAGFETSTLEIAIGDVVSMLDDVAIDVPMAPKLLAKVVAKVVAANAVALDFITAAGSGIEDVGFRREFCGAALVELKSSHFKGLVPGALDLQAFAAGEAEDTVTEWLRSLALSELA